jgi:predicted RNA-binding Zn-ribbon protein involved in translation (DUF1610 family)
MSTTLDPVTLISVIPKPLLCLDSKECPHCGFNLVAQEIPAESRHLYIPMEKNRLTGRYENGKDDGRKMHFSHVIAVSSLVFDRTLAYSCPECKEVDVIPGCEAMMQADQDYWEAHDRVEALKGPEVPSSRTGYARGIG